ncbi:MAG: hypothetical protein DWQ36_06890 [Acidobacteria bacterium]|mgnify:CR=1 FL=1|nr:MAG: hypothetical protein DWQ30_24325 [Acidobacteriota bacterium]REK09273.1 MAG: hypothetical protein DWQ36_06890 [Acidobacteriota bacterium]
MTAGGRSDERSADGRRRLRHWIVGALVLASTGALANAFMIDLCDLVYDCGCRSLWDGAAEDCNIHDATTHDCPWCTTGRLGVVLPPALVLATQGLIAFWPGRLAWWKRLLLALLAFPAVGGAVGLGFGLATGYWS